MMSPGFISAKDFQRAFTDKVDFLKNGDGSRTVIYTSVCRHCGKEITVVEKSRKAAKKGRRSAKSEHLVVCPVFTASGDN